MRSTEVYWNIGVYWDFQGAYWGLLRFVIVGVVYGLTGPTGFYSGPWGLLGVCNMWESVVSNGYIMGLTVGQIFGSSIRVLL